MAVPFVYFIFMFMSWRTVQRGCSFYVFYMQFYVMEDGVIWAFSLSILYLDFRHGGRGSVAISCRSLYHAYLYELNLEFSKKNKVFRVSKIIKDVVNTNYSTVLERINGVVRGIVVR